MSIQNLTMISEIVNKWHLFFKIQDGGERHLEFLQLYWSYLLCPMLYFYTWATCRWTVAGYIATIKNMQRANFFCFIAGFLLLFTSKFNLYVQPFAAYMAVATVIVMSLATLTIESRDSVIGCDIELFVYVQCTRWADVNRISLPW